MEARRINSYSSPYKRLLDKIGTLSKSVKLKRMEPYADVIGEVFESYNNNDDERTMMFKLIRHPEPGTTERKKHTENVRDIAGEIADNFSWLNSDITRIMARKHDAGHTFLGHSGEWWIANINDTYGLPNYVHNAIGSRNFIYREKIYDEVEKAIYAKYPNISHRKIGKIKNDLWLIIDGINCHNGEKSEYSYSPNFSKSEKRFEEEIMGCYVKKGFDRTLVPATAEGSLMRLCDKISYIPFDMVDIFRNHCQIETQTIDGVTHNFYQEYAEKLKELGMPDGSLERLLKCKTEEEYDSFAKEMQRFLIQDVLANTRRNNIRMSPEMSRVLHGIRDINNQVMVNYTVMKEDHEVYIPAIDKLMKRFASVLIQNYIIDKNDIDNSPILKCEIDPQFSELLLDSFSGSSVLKGFSEYIAKITAEDFNFTVQSCKKSIAEIIDSELDVARDVATGRILRENIQARGNKAERIDTYINSFSKSLDIAYNENLFHEFSKNPINNFKKKIWLSKAKKKIKEEALSLNPKYENARGTLPLYEMVAMEIGAQYLASLNDREFFDLIKRAELITPEQEKSLQRQYHTFDFRAEHKKHSDWDNITKLQKIDAAKEKRARVRQGKSIFDRLRGR